MRYLSRLESVSVGLVSLCTLLVLGLTLPQPVEARTAGKIKRVEGQAMAATPRGQIRLLKKGDRLRSGETISTGPNSLAQLNFTDGGVITLRPNSRFQIKKYRYKKEPKKDRSIFGLLKGGLRAISGLIGKRNHRSYSMTTAVATIGIRGTDYEIRQCAGDCQDIFPLPADGLYVGVTEGTDSRIILKNNASIRQLVAGQFAFVSGMDKAIIPLAVRPPVLANTPLICK